MPSLFLPSGVYAIPESDRSWLIAWSLPEDPIGFDFTPAGQQRFTDLIWPELHAHLPVFDSLKVETAWAGLYDVNTMDGNAILGEWPRIRGLFLATGFSGHGFQQSPAVGRYLAELILGRSPTLDLSAARSGEGCSTTSRSTSTPEDSSECTRDRLVMRVYVRISSVGHVGRKRPDHETG